MTTLALEPKLSTEESICEDFAIALMQLVRASERHHLRTPECERARALLESYGYIERGRR